MIKKLKGKKDDNKVSKQDVRIKCAFKQKYNDTILFSFKYITTQKEFSLEGLKKNKNARQNISIIDDFHTCLSKLSNEGWENTRKKAKGQGGIETIPYSDIYFKAHDPKNDLKLAKDTKLWIARFGGDKYRLIGCKSDSCQLVFHILGIDYKFSAYDHGS